MNQTLLYSRFNMCNIYIVFVKSFTKNNIDRDICIEWKKVRFMDMINMAEI